jgi:Sec-independent protein translocase protein TatA
LYARYIDYANEHHGRKMRYDTPLPSYKLISSAISSVRGYKKSPKGQNRQLNVEFRQEYEKKRETYKAKQKLEKQALKEQDRPISKKAYNKSLYGGKPMKEKQESIKQVSVSEREYNEFLKWKNRKKK